jgi:hypothetical protein
MPNRSSRGGAPREQALLRRMRDRPGLVVHALEVLARPAPIIALTECPTKTASTSPSSRQISTTSSA